MKGKYTIMYWTKFNDSIPSDIFQKCKGRTIAVAYSIKPFASWNQNIQLKTNTIPQFDQPV